jgi:hypothetical protein
MDQNEKGMIENLFGRLQQAEAQSGARDAAAEAAIRESVVQQPAAPYYMAQAILVQEHALQNLNNRVEELERELAERPAGGGFLGGLFGAGQSREAAETRSARPSPFQQADLHRAQGGSGFLGGALQTAAALVGGVLLGNAISGLFAQDASAVEPIDEPTAPEVPPSEEEPDSPWDAGGDEDFF